ncbi:MAG: hypothetical protein NTW76_02095 [Corynebacteriales bacterium]|nr:hypothetical protein [Mycobacteriales bacterium]
MTKTNTKTTTNSDHKAPHPDTVNADITPGVLVYHRGEHRDGTVADVPWALAETWLRQRWATMLWHH